MRCAVAALSCAAPNAARSGVYAFDQFLAPEYAFASDDAAACERFESPGLKPPCRRADFKAVRASESLMLAQDPAAVPDSRSEAGGEGARASSDSNNGFAEPPGPEWGLAPIRWGGNVSVETRRRRVSNEPYRLQQVEIANLRGASYLWQPWFAQLSGGLGVITAKEHGAQGENELAAPSSSSNTLTGGAALSVFPVSRFPFYANYDRTDSRASNEITNSDFTTTRFGLRQNYHAAEGVARYTASFDRSILDSSSFGRDTVDLFAGGLNRTAGPQSLDLAGSRARNSRSDTGEGSQLDRMIARHGLRPDALTSVDSLVSVSNSQFHILTNGQPTDNRSRFTQASTFSTWRAGEGSPLYLSGGARVFRSAIDTSGTTAESDTLSGNIAANYAFTRHTHLSGAATATRLTTDSTSQLVTTETGAVSYVPAAIPVANFFYTWNASANVGNQNGGTSGSGQNIGGQLGHNLTRISVLSEISSVTTTVGQSYASLFDTLTSSSETLAHTGSVSWQAVPNTSSTAFISLFGADSRTSGHNENEFQLVNLQANGQLQFSRHSLSGANLTVQAIRQSTPTTPSAGFNTTSGGTLSYQHLRAFDVPRLRYTVLLAANQTQYATRIEGDVNAPRQRVSGSFEQRLDYAVGRIEMQLLARSARIEGQRNELIFLRLNRQFGAF
jgi:hypothetical protein